MTKFQKLLELAALDSEDAARLRIAAEKWAAYRQYPGKTVLGSAADRHLRKAALAYAKAFGEIEHSVDTAAVVRRRQCQICGEFDGKHDHTGEDR